MMVCTDVVIKDDNNNLHIMSFAEQNRFHHKMGRLITRVTRIQKSIFGVPIQTIHKYRETYHGEVKDCADCRPAKV